MDLWVVAAATGAGYLAKYLQNSAGEKEELSESSSQLLDQTSLFCRFARKTESKYNMDVFSRRDEDVTNGNYEISDILTLNSWQENAGAESEYMDSFENDGDVLYGLETNRFTRNGPLSSRRDDLFSVKPLRSLHNSVTKLNKEKIMKKGYTFSPPPSPSMPFVGPLIVNQIINRNASDLYGEFANDFSLGEKNDPLRSCLSRQSGLVELPRTRKHKVGKGQKNIASSGDTLLSQGPLTGMVLFFAGITIGILSSVIANKRELNNMNAQLVQKENLVRDLHEEIEMRDKLNVKEIFKEDNQSIESTNPERMSKIEAELEAELEKLELNITSSGLEDMSDFVVLDDYDAIGTSTYHTHSLNYAVSPWELSVRLHEVIQSRLEARIEELEQALKYSRKRHSIELLGIISDKGSKNDEFGSSSTPETQMCIYENDDMDPSEEASDDYNEAYEEVARMINSDEETPYST